MKTDTILRNGVTQELHSRGSDRVLFGESSDLWGRKCARKAARVATYLMRESSDPIASSRDIWIMSRAAVTRSITQTKQAGGALGHTQPFVKFVGGAESSQGDSIRVDH